MQTGERTSLDSFTRVFYLEDVSIGTEKCKHAKKSLGGRAWIANLKTRWEVMLAKWITNVAAGGGRAYLKELDRILKPSCLYFRLCFRRSSRIVTCESQED